MTANVSVGIIGVFDKPLPSAGAPIGAAIEHVGWIYGKQQDYVRASVLADPVRCLGMVILDVAVPAGSDEGIAVNTAIGAWAAGVGYNFLQACTKDRSGNPLHWVQNLKR